MQICPSIRRSQNSSDTEFKVIYSYQLFQTFPDPVPLYEGDRITFGHPNGVNLLPGTRVRQPNSEYQYIVSHYLSIVRDCLSAQY